MLVFFLLGLTTSAPTRAAGWKLTTGHIEELVRGENQVKLTIRPDRKTTPTGNDSQTDPTTELQPNLVVRVPLQECPKGLEVGAQVRVWTKSGKSSSRCCISLKNRNDPTGVRARLRRRGRGFGGHRGGRGHGGGH